ncbi:hypothetical protein AB836_00910 [Rickettsiales bacterium (ex Bugula neritina AB1)]|nr:hypothetical protein AB836_00910 [Rickettsiales bacterium (ex Bugula neritina AB1)]
MIRYFVLLMTYISTINRYTSPYTTKIASALSDAYIDMKRMDLYMQKKGNDDFIEFFKNAFNFTGNISDISTYTIETVQHMRSHEGYWSQFWESITIRVITKFLFKIFERILEYFAISFDKIPIYEVLKKSKKKIFKIFLNEKEMLMWKKIKNLMSLKFPKGEKPVILIYGEPGVGKTLLIRNLLQSLPKKNKIIYLHASNIFTTDENKNVSIAELNKVIDMLIKNPDYILVIDDVEIILSARYYFHQHYKNDQEKEFSDDFRDMLRTISTLILFVFSRRETRTILISNLPNVNNIDPSISRRINYMCYISLPNLNTRSKMWRHKIIKYKIHINDLNIDEAIQVLGNASYNFSLRDINAICRNFKESHISIKDLLNFIEEYTKRLKEFQILSNNMKTIFENYSL